MTRFVFLAIGVLLIAALQYSYWYGDSGHLASSALEEAIEREQRLNDRLEQRNRVLAAEVEALRSGLEAVEARAHGPGDGRGGRDVLPRRRRGRRSAGEREGLAPRKRRPPRGGPLPVSAGFERWPRANVRAAEAKGVLRTVPEDFEVTETLAFEPSGTGEHLYLFVEKRAITTGEAHRRLAEAFGVPRADVSYAGMKDRHAVARQWFSVRGPRDEAVAPCPELRVLRRARHPRKLRRGELRSNRFRIRVRAVSDDVEPHLRRVARHGVPNYFGPQRFGVDGGNVAAARQWTRAGRPRVPRFTRGLHLSSLRSFLFNEVLGHRVADGTWDTVLAGEALLEGAPSGPLWGRGTPASCDAALELESATAGAFPDIADTLEHAGLRQERRALRLEPTGLSWSLEEDVLTVECVLPKGVYATSVLREVGAFRDARAEAPAGGRAAGGRAAA